MLTWMLFFASVEQRDTPELKGKPVIVGRDSNRSIVVAASYEARKYGIRSAMPIFKAKQACKDLCIVTSNIRKYQDESKKIMEIFMTYSPLVEQMSVDEAYIDIKGCKRLFGDHTKIITEIKNRIKSERHLTCSIGAAPVKFLAKIASDINKPDGVLIIEPHMAKDFAKSMSIEKIPGVGKKAYEQMKILNIKKLGDILKFQPSILNKKFGSFATRLIEYANCIDSTVNTSRHRKSISSETTLSEDTNEIETIKKYLLIHSKNVGMQLRKKNLMTNNVSIKLKFSDFSQITRQKTINNPISSTQSIYGETLNLLGKLAIKKKLRLISVNVACLDQQNMPLQMEILSEVRKKIEKWEKVDKAMDSISTKFGNNIIKNASLNKKR